MVLGILKYPAPYSSVVNPDVVAKNKKPFSHEAFKIKYAKPPKCYLDTEVADIGNWLFEPLSESDKKLFTTIQGRGNEAHAKTIYKALDTSVLELADDISYGVHDLEDGIGLKLISRDDWEDVKGKVPPSLLGVHSDIQKKLFSKDTCDRKAAIGSLVHLFICATLVSVNSSFSEPLLKYNITHSDEHSKYLDVLKDLTFMKMVHNPNVQLLEYKGMTIIIKLFEIISSDPERFLPRSDVPKYKELPDVDRPRFICDYIAGMSDSYATKIYEKVTLPGHGSFLDLI